MIVVQDIYVLPPDLERKTNKMELISTESGHISSFTNRKNTVRSKMVLLLPGFSLSMLATYAHAAEASLKGAEQMTGDALTFFFSGVMGFLSALVLCNLTRVVIAGGLLLAALALASTLGVTLFYPDFLWQVMTEALHLVPSLRELIAGVLQLGVKPVLVIGYLLGLFVGLLGLQSFV